MLGVGSGEVLNEHIRTCRSLCMAACGDLVQVVRATGHIGVVGVYVPQDPDAATEEAKQGRVAFDYGLVFDKGISIGSGQCPVKRYNRELRDLVVWPGHAVVHRARERVVGADPRCTLSAHSRSTNPSVSWRRSQLRLRHRRAARTLRQSPDPSCPGRCS